VHEAEARRVRLERLLQIAAHEYDLRLDFGRSDLLGEGHIVMGIDQARAAASSPLALKGIALHLLGHYLAGSLEWADPVRRMEAQGRPFLMMLWHALEDARVENGLVRRWPGALAALTATQPPRLGSLLRIMPAARQLELGIYLVGRGDREARFADPIQQALDGIAPLVIEAAQAESPRAAFEAVQTIYPAVAHLLRGTVGREAPHRLEDQPRQVPPDTQTARAGDQPPEHHPPGDVPEIDVTDDRVRVSALGRRSELPEWFRPGSAPWFERGIGHKAVHPSAVRTDRQTIVEVLPGQPDVYRAIQAEVQREAGFLAQRLTNLLREEVYLRYEGQHRTGKIHMARLWRQRLGFYRLFQRPAGHGRRAVAFTLLVDESTSMKGQGKSELARKTAILLGETLARLEVPLEIIGFSTADFEARAAMRLGLTPAHQYRTTRCTPLEHRIYKRFDEPYHLARCRLTSIQPRHNNWDEEHLLFAFRRIQARSERRKVIIVISDGQPNGDASALIDAVAQVESLGCRVVGIGIGADFVRQIYPQTIVVSDFQQMAGELAELLMRVFRDGQPLTGWHPSRPAAA
jgi:hypothetical protein